MPIHPSQQELGQGSNDAAQSLLATAVLTIRRARLPVTALPETLAARGGVGRFEPWVECDVTVRGECIAQVGPPASGTAAGPEFDAAGRLVFPALIDAHVHLDKTHTWDRSPNRTGTFADALASLAADRVHWSEEDLRSRVEFGLGCAYAHGTSVIRSHVDTWLPGGETSHAVFAEARRRWAGRVELQTVPLCAGEAVQSAQGEALADLALKYGASALGGFFTRSPDLDAQLDRLLALADERGVGVDLHVDENGDPQAEVLRAVADAVLRRGFRRPVVCGHCCNLAVQPPHRVRSTLERVRAAGIGIVALPDCNLYLQGRRPGQFPRSPVWRGLTLINDLWDAGVPVACASDNVRDAFHPYGDYDPFAVWALAVKLGHLDERLAESAAVVTSAAARLVGRPNLARIEAGAPAHLVVLPARTFGELLSRPPGPRRRIDGITISQPEQPEWVERMVPMR